MDAHNMSITKTIKVALQQKEMQQKDVSDILNITTSNFYNQLKRDNFRLSDIIKIMDIIGYDTEIVFRDKESGQELKVE